MSLVHQTLQGVWLGISFKTDWHANFRVRNCSADLHIGSCHWPPFIGTILAKTLQSDERIKLKTGGHCCQWRKSQLQNGGEVLVVNNLKHGNKDVPVLFDRAVKTKNKTCACSTSPQELSPKFHYCTTIFRYITVDASKSLSTHLKALNCSFKHSNTAKVYKIQL